MMRSTVWSGTSARPELSRLVGQHRLHDVAAEMGVLRPSGRDFGAHVGAPDHLVGRRFDVLALEQVLALLVAGEVDDLVPVVAQRPGDREEHRVAQAAAEQQHVLPLRDLGWRSGRPHDHHGLALAQVGHEPARHAELERNHRQQAVLPVDPGAGQRDPFHEQGDPAAVHRDAPRHRLEVLEPVELSRTEVPRGGRRLHYDLHDRRRQTNHVFDVRVQLGVERRRQLRPARRRVGPACVDPARPARARTRRPPAGTRPSPTPSP